MDFVEYVITGPSPYYAVEYATEAGRFLSGTFDTFITPISWTFPALIDSLPEYWDAAGTWIGELIWEPPAP